MRAVYSFEMDALEPIVETWIVGIWEDGKNFCLRWGWIWKTVRVGSWDWEFGLEDQWAEGRV